MKTIQLIYCLVSVGIFFSCAREKEITPTPVSNPIAVSHLKEAQEIASSARLTCEREPCAKNVAMVTFATDTVAAQCTGFLVSENILMTNSHCIPEDIRRSGASCRDRIWAFFPKADRVECDQVISVSSIGASPEQRSGEGLEIPDYAFLRLDFKGLPLPINFRGFENHEQIKLIKVDPTGFELGGKTVMVGNMTESFCQISYNTFLSPESIFSRAAIMAFSGACNAIPGNSGSPMFGARGEVKGIIHARLREKVVEERLRGKKDLLLDREFEVMGLGSNFSCIPFPGGPNIGEHCTNRAALDGVLAQDAEVAQFLHTKTKREDYSVSDFIGIDRGLQWTMGELPLGIQDSLDTVFRRTNEFRFAFTYRIPLPLCFYQVPQDFIRDVDIEKFRFGYNRYLEEESRWYATVTQITSSTSFSSRGDRLYAATSIFWNGQNYILGEREIRPCGQGLGLELARAAVDQQGSYFQTIVAEDISPLQSLSRIVQGIQQH